MNTISAKIKLTFALMAVVLLGTILFYYHVVMSSNEEYRAVIEFNFQEVALAHVTRVLIQKAYDEWEDNISESEYINGLLSSALAGAERIQHHQEVGGNIAGLDYTKQIIETIKKFSDSFQKLIGVWQLRGLDYQSGLLGDMRADAHELETFLGNFDTAPLQGIFGQMQASEKTFILENQPSQVDNIHRQHDQFIWYLQRSTVAENMRIEIVDAMQAYIDAVAAYAAERKNTDHAIELDSYKNMERASQSTNMLLQSLFVPNALTTYLQARRHEKDYLVRHDTLMVARMRDSLTMLRDRVHTSGISHEDKKQIIEKTNQYELAFINLVEQEQIIAKNTRELHIYWAEINNLMNDLSQQVRYSMKSSFVVMGYSLETIIHRGLFVSVAIFMGAILFIWSIASKYITTPLKALEAATIAISRGELEIGVHTYNDDEIRSVALALREMAKELSNKSKALEHAYTYNENIILSITDTLVVITPEGIIKRFNRNDLLGYDQQDLIGTHIGRLVADISGSAEQAFLSRLYQMDFVFNGEGVLTRPDGTRVPVLIASSVIASESGVTTDIVLMIKDISNIKKINEKLEHARQEAEAASKAKSLFVANMSHEIRTPMNAVLGMTHLCLQTKMTSQQKDYLEKIYSSANGLLRIINEILDFSKIESGKMDVESVAFHLDDVLRNLATMATMRAHQKAIEVIFIVARGVPRTLIGDPLRLGQVLINLVGNAIKFTESGEVVVSVDQREETETTSTMLFKVVDTGIGLTEQQISRLFRAFSQADDSTTRKYGGTGLGLTISKRLVELMGGEIHVDSKIGHGTTFWFTIRFGIPSHSVRRSLTTPEMVVGKRVLVVDDNRTSREMLRQTLQSFALDVDLAASAAEGLEKLERSDQSEQPPDLLLVDWQMPEMNGIEMLHRLQAKKLDRRPLTCLMTTIMDREKTIQQSADVKPDRYIDKPIDISSLFDVIMTIFGQEGFLHPRRHTNAQQVDRLLLSGAKILLAEDNEINQQIAKELLEMVGILVTIAGNGLEAVQFVQESAFDLVLMDLQMPEMDGLDATREIRMIYSMEQLPIIAMTANVMTDDISRCLAAGMNDHIGKPIDPHKLYVTLSLWVKPREGISAFIFPGDGQAVAKEIPISDARVLPGIDVDAGLARVAGNMELFKTLLRKFAGSHANTIEEMRSAVDGGDFKLAWRLAHTLKGVAGSIGANRLYWLARECELRLKPDGNRSGELFSTALGEELQFVLQAIDKLHDSLVVDRSPAVESTAMTKEKEVAVDMVVLRQHLAGLKPYLERRRPKECMPIIEALEKMVVPTMIVQEINSVIRLVKSYKYKESMAAIDVVLDKLGAHASSNAV